MCILKKMNKYRFKSKSVKILSKVSWMSYVPWYYKMGPSLSEVALTRFGTKIQQDISI